MLEKCHSLLYILSHAGPCEDPFCSKCDFNPTECTSCIPGYVVRSTDRLCIFDTPAISIAALIGEEHTSTETLVSYCIE